MFQFQCPQGDLLEGDESQAGQTIHCPVCGKLFVVPEPIAAPPHAPAPAPQPAAKSELLHIPCPNGHELEVPPEMLDTDVLCPQCDAQFHLRASDSLEHRRKRERQERLRDEQANKFWLRFSISIVVLVALLLATLIILSAVNRGPSEDRPKPGRRSAVGGRMRRLAICNLRNLNVINGGKNYTTSGSSGVATNSIAGPSST